MSEMGKFLGNQLSKIISRKTGQAIADQVNKGQSLKELDYNASFEFELRPNKAQGIGSLLFIVLGFAGIIFGIIYLVEGTFDPANNGVALWLGLVSFFLGGYLFLHSKVTYVKLSNSFINAKGLFKPEVEMRYNDITKIIFKDKTYMDIYAGKEKVRIFLAYSGSSVTYPILHNKVPVEVYGPTLLTNDFYYKEFTRTMDPEQKEYFIIQLREIYAEMKK